MKKQINSFGISNFTNAFMEVYEDKHAIVHYILSDQLNKGQQRFDVNGYQDLKRPLVMFNHGLAGMWNEPTDPRETIKYMIATNEWIAKVNGYLKAKTIFDKDDDFSMDLYNAYKKGKWTDWSVRWNYLLDDKGRVQDGSYAEIEEDGGYILQINKYVIEEYSAVFIGKDPNAVTEMLNSLDDFKSNQFKKYISDIHLNSQTQNSEELTNLQLELTELKSQFENKNGEAVEYTNEAVTKAVQLLKPRLLEISDNINKLSQITLKNEQTLSNIDSIIESKVQKVVTGVISQALGQV